MGFSFSLTCRRSFVCKYGAKLPILLICAILGDVNWLALSGMARAHGAKTRQRWVSQLSAIATVRWLYSSYLFFTSDLFVVKFHSWMFILYHCHLYSILSLVASPELSFGASYCTSVVLGLPLNVHGVYSLFRASRIKQTFCALFHFSWRCSIWCQMKIISVNSLCCCATFHVYLAVHH